MPADFPFSEALAFTQSGRLFTLSFAPGSSIEDGVLLPQELSGDEAVSEGFTYTLTCLSSDAHLELKQFIGLPVQVSLLTDGGEERALCGLVTRAEFAGSDGGFTRYVLTLQDPFAVLSRRVNSRVFQDLSVLEFVDVLLQEHRQNNPVLASCFDLDDRCMGEHPAQSWVTQYNESDTAFICRWLAQEGISWYFEHGEAGVPGEHPKLTLVLFDDVSVLESASADKVRFHRDDGTESEDSITAWQGVRTLQPGGTERASYDYKSVVTSTQQDGAGIDQGEHGEKLASTLEDVRYEPHHSANDEDDYARYGKLRIGAHEFASKTFNGSGSHRELTVGRYFELADHPVHDQDAPEDRQFTVLRTRLFARNNLLQEDKGNEPVFRTDFDATRRHIPIIPAFSTTEHSKPVAPTLLTAVVVGPPGEEIHVNEYGCIKVRMPFTRSLDHAFAEGAGASGTDKDSLWIRVAQPWTGSHYGQVWIPRIGDEVLIQFINGDIDRPIVTGSVYNGTHRPAAFTDAGNLPGNKALSGIKSKMYKGRGLNEIVWDDSTNEQRIRTATDHGKTSLNQGYLVHPRRDGKGEPRGEGFELRTDQYGALRAGRGMLISTEARNNENSTHLDSKELANQLASNLELSKLLSDAAKDHNADPLEANEEAERLIKVASKTYTQQGGTGQKAEVPGYEEPLLAFSSPAGIVSATPKSHEIATGEHIHLSSQQDTNIAVGNKLSMAIKEAWSVFVAKSGIKLFAGKGKVQIQAQDDEIEAIAKKDIKVTSVDGHIDITAPKSIRLTAGGCQIEVGNGQITLKAPGPVNIHGSVKNLTGPATTAAVFPALPSTDLRAIKKNTQLVVLSDEDGHILKNRPYRIWMKTGEVIEGTTDRYGATKVLESDAPAVGKIEILKRIS
ncbi:type VI secretion system Vgr family protein [Noviherbaspirillum sp. ST9]|uniref:type VI secretion system Vgr family protein n=1 Tax=Noviherbaspirillum sp. ST9 TaxID=3401606 RepID=UPI003B587159